MEPKYRNGMAVFLAITFAIGTLAIYGCPKKADVSSVPETQAPAKADLAAKEKAEAEEQSKERAAAAVQGLQPIYFDFDRSNVRDDARSVMKANAEWLKANPNVKVRIEGNCDERGTIEYNQALGQRRAQNAKQYLADLGIAASRISLISYGKEKPVCTASDEACWQKNRRGDFVVVSRQE